ncbi:MAG: TetR family transcriptional regulator [Selenomonadaceae bacterium]|nr:TetR family transcriptional regulator [Selenomonadaceae bacterium]
MKYRDESIEQNVVQKALAILDRRGLRGWNMTELADETGLAKNTLYRIIGSKEKLMEQIAEFHCEKIYAKLMQILEEDGEFFTKLEKLVETYVELTPIYFAEIFREFPRIESTISEKNSEARKKSIQYIKLGKARGFIREDLDAEWIFDLLRAVGLHYRANESESERREKIRFAFHCIFHGIIKDDQT